jgi:hypothetical protein
MLDVKMPKLDGLSAAEKIAFPVAGDGPIASAVSLARGHGPSAAIDLLPLGVPRRQADGRETTGGHLRL